MSVGFICPVLSQIFFGQTNPSETKKIGEITQSMIDSSAMPIGYNGSENKVGFDPKSGKISFNETASGRDVGFFVEFLPVNVGSNGYLTVTLKGNVLQKEGWAKFGVIQVKDSEGERYDLQILCQSIFSDCTQEAIVNISKGATL